MSFDQTFNAFKLRHKATLNLLADQMQLLMQHFHMPIDVIIDGKVSHVLLAVQHLLAEECEGTWKTLMAAIDTDFKDSPATAELVRKRLTEEVRGVSRLQAKKIKPNFTQDTAYPPYPSNGKQR